MTLSIVPAMREVWHATSNKPAAIFHTGFMLTDMAQRGISLEKQVY